MASRTTRAASLVCLGLVSTVSSTRVTTCGFVAPCVSLFQRSGTVRSAARMTLSEGTEAAPKPYSDLPADWRSPLPREDAPPESQGAREEEEEESREDQQQAEERSAAAAKVVQEAKQVTPSDAIGKKRSARRAEAPPGVEGLQTENQRRRALPLSQLKRVKPKRRSLKEEEGEFRPLVPKTDRESVLRGEDYWIDYREVDAEAARKEARAKAPAPDQFAQSKMKAEIVNPYKQNWILAISLAIVAIAGFVRINPGILDDPSIITFPNEL